MLKNLSPLGAAAWVAAVGALLAFGTTADAQVKRSGAGYLFRMKHVKGDKLEYRMVSTTPKPVNPGDPKKIEGPMTMTVLDVDRGIARIRLEVGPFLLDGKPAGPPKNTMEVRLDSRGKVAAGGVAMAQLGGIQFPEKPLKVGETFEAINSTNIGTTKMTVRSICKFVGIRKMGSRQVAELSVNVTSTGLAPTTGIGTQYLDMADGQLLSAKLNQEAGANVGGRAVIVKNVMTISRKGFK